MIRMLCFTTALLLVAGVASAEQYWIAYEGNDFPENEGWVRHVSDPPPERWLEDGSFFIDSRADPHTTDNYTMYFDDGGVDPEPGEMFVLWWRLLVEESHLWDPGIYVTSDDRCAVSFIFDEGSLLSFYEPDVYVEFEPGAFHEFEMSSADMRTYELFIDGDLAIEGVFFEGLFSACVGFGDIVHGGASLAAWDYFRFGVVPEPDARVLYALALLAMRNLR